MMGYFFWILAVSGILVLFFGAVFSVMIAIDDGSPAFGAVALLLFLIAALCMAAALDRVKEQEGTCIIIDEYSGDTRSCSESE